MLLGGSKLSEIVVPFFFRGLELDLPLFVESSLYIILIFLERICCAREGCHRYSTRSGVMVETAFVPNDSQYCFKASEIHLGILSRNSTFSSRLSILFRPLEEGCQDSHYDPNEGRRCGGKQGREDEVFDDLSHGLRAMVLIISSNRPMSL